MKVSLRLALTLLFFLEIPLEFEEVRFTNDLGKKIIKNKHYF